MKIKTKDGEEVELTAEEIRMLGLDNPGKLRSFVFSLRDKKEIGFNASATAGGK